MGKRRNHAFPRSDIADRTETSGTNVFDEALRHFLAATTRKKKVQLN